MLPSSPEAGPSDASARSADAGAGADGADAFACALTATNPTTCNALTPSGPLIVDMCVAGEPPTPQGGPIQDGVYVLDSVTYYGATAGHCVVTTSGKTERITWVVCGNDWQSVEELGDGAMPRPPPRRPTT